MGSLARATLREQVEIASNLVTIVCLAAAHVSQTGWTWEVARPLAALGAIFLLASHHELAIMQAAAGYGYPTRAAASQGLAVGALAVPCMAAGLHVHTLRDGSALGFAAMLLDIACAASLAMLGVALASVRPVVVDTEPRGPAAAPRSGPDRGPKPGLANGELTYGVEAVAGAAACTTAPAFRGGACSRLERSASHEAWAVRVGVGTASATAVLVVSGMVGAGAPAQAVLGSAVCAVGAGWALPLLLTRLPGCFTMGEALVVAGGALLLSWDVACICVKVLAAYGLRTALYNFLRWPLLPTEHFWVEPATGRSSVSLFVELLLFGALAIGVAAAPLLCALCVPRATPCSDSRLRHRLVPPAAALACLVATAAAAAVRPAVWAMTLAVATPRRCALLAAWAALLGAALPAMDALARSRTVPNIIVRKGYHLLALALFAPALVVEPQLLAVALAVAAAALIAVEAARVGRVPRAGPAIHAFMTRFIDGRDAGAVLVTHFSLLLGMAAPVWLSSAPAALPGASIPDLGPALAGVVILGLADSAASAVGRAFGKTRILGTNKTLEGTAGGVAAALAGWMAVWPACCGRALPPLALMAATLASCVLEAATTQLDNIFLPLHHFALVLLV